MRAWLNAQSSTFDQLRTLDGQASESLTLDLIVQMQSVRREFADVEVPACAAEAALYSHLLFANVIDYWIAMHAGENAEAADIAAQNTTWAARADEAIDTLSAPLTAGGAFGGAPAVAGGRVLIWDVADSYTKLDGLAFINDFDLAFADWRLNEETLATLDDPEVGALVVGDACDDENMDRVIPRLGEFVANGGHLWIFYDSNWLDCNDLVREHLGFTLIEDYEWHNQSIPAEALLSWLEGLELNGGGYVSVYLMTRGQGEQGFATEDEEQRLLITSYPHNGGRVSLFPMFNYGPIWEDDQIDNYDHSEAALRIMQYLSGRPLP